MKFFVLLALLAFLASCSPSLPPLQTVQDFNVNRYDGEWHEIARLPNRFEKGIVAAKATYGVGLQGPVAVKNQGLKADGQMTSITGSANIVGKGKLKVRFDTFPANLFAGDYWILWINKSYTKVIVGSPDRHLLWLLSKDPGALAKDFVDPLQQMKAQGFPIENLIENPQRLPPEPSQSLLVRNGEFPGNKLTALSFQEDGSGCNRSKIASKHAAPKAEDISWKLAKPSSPKCHASSRQESPR